MRFYLSSRTRLGVALAASSLVAVVLYALGAIFNDDMPYGYLFWNLVLAWVPLVLAVLLLRTLRSQPWSDWPPLLLTLLWLSFLPNSFYVITDLIHLQEIPRVDPLFDIAVFSAFVLNSLILGYLSLFIVHQELIKRLSKRMSTLLVGAVLLVSSFAVYIGRDLRWNTWDIVINPASVLFDVSDRLLHPAAHPKALSATIGFFLLLSSIYAVVWQMGRAWRSVK